MITAMDVVDHPERDQSWDAGGTLGDRNPTIGP